MMRLDAKWESLLHLMRKTILLMPTDPSSERKHEQDDQRTESELDCYLGLLLPKRILSLGAAILTSSFGFCAYATVI